MTPTVKACTHCGEQRATTEYYRDRTRSDCLTRWCKPCLSRHKANYCAANRAKITTQTALYRAANRQTVRAKAAAYARRRRALDDQVNIQDRLRARLSGALRGGRKAGRFWDLIGCTPADLRAHLEVQFVDGMAWSNRSEWHVDHIMPVARFDLSDPAQQRRCFHFTNLQPLWASDNRAKGARVLECQQ